MRPRTLMLFFGIVIGSSFLPVYGTHDPDFHHSTPFQVHVELVDNSENYQDAYDMSLAEIQKMERIGCAYYTEWCDEDGIEEDEFYFIWTNGYEVSNIEISSEKTLEQVLARCAIPDYVELHHDLIWFYNATHYIDNGNCQWQDSVVCGDNQFQVGNSCKTMYPNPDLDPKLLLVLGSCHSQFNNEISDLMLVNWQNNTHFIDNVSCQWQHPNQCNERDFLSNNQCQNHDKGIVPPWPRYMGIQYCGAIRDGGCNGEFVFKKIAEIPESTSELVSHEGFTDEPECGEGTMLIDGVCVVTNHKICDPDDDYAYDCGVADVDIDMTNGQGTVIMILIIVIPVSVIVVGFIIWMKRK